jgi:hypothetical protein
MIEEEERIVERNIALAAGGSHEVYFKAWGERAVGAENTLVWSDSQDLLNKLKSVCEGGRCCINKLYVFSHGGIYGTREEWDASQNAARLFLRDLYECVRDGKIVFCENGVITLTGCRVAATDFPALLATLSGCVVKAARGMSYPKPGGEGSPFPSERPGEETGEWLSGDGDIPEADKGSYLGWMKYAKDNIRGECIGELLDDPLNTYLLRIW